MTIRAITAAATRPIRQVVLRPHQRVEDLVLPGDDAPDSVHFGAFLDTSLVGIASIFREPMPGDGHPGDWRLRGMATLPEVRGQGFGGRLLEACIRHIGDQGGSRFWCNGRADVVDFYRKYRFETLGEPFDLPDIGPHYLLARPIP